jgi:hypothetical protein
LNAKASKAIGEELARLTEANKLLGDAVKQSAGSFECKVRASLKFSLCHSCTTYGYRKF